MFLAVLPFPTQSLPAEGGEGEGVGAYRKREKKRSGEGRSRAKREKKKGGPRWACPFWNVCVKLLSALHQLSFQFKTKFFAHFDEGCDTLVELRAIVSGRNLHADTCLFFRNDRIIESSDIDTFLLHLLSVNL